MIIDLVLKVDDLLSQVVNLGGLLLIQKVEFILELGQVGNFVKKALVLANFVRQLLFQTMDEMILLLFTHIEGLYQ